MAGNRDITMFKKKMGAICFSLFFSMFVGEFIIVPLLFVLNTGFVSRLPGFVRSAIVVAGVILFVLAGVVSFIGSYRYMMRNDGHSS